MSGRLPVAAGVAGLDEGVAASLAQRMSRAEFARERRPVRVDPSARAALALRGPHGRPARRAACAGGRRARGAAARHRVSSPRTWRRCGPEAPRASSSGLMRAAGDALARDAPAEAGALLRRALAEGAAEPPRGRCCCGSARSRSAAAIRSRPSICAKRSSCWTSRAIGPWRPCRSGRSSSTAETGRRLRQLIEDARGELGATSTPRWTSSSMSLTPCSARSTRRSPRAFWRDRPRLVSRAHGDSWAAHALCALLALHRPPSAASTSTRSSPSSSAALAGDVLLSQRGAGAWTPAHLLSAVALLEHHASARSRSPTTSPPRRVHRGRWPAASWQRRSRGWNAARWAILPRPRSCCARSADTARRARNAPARS